MKYTNFLGIQSLLKNDAGAKLLKTRSASLVISFLYNQFRAKNVTTILSDELEMNLASFLKAHSDEEKILRDEENSDLLAQIFIDATDIQTRARRYITLWCGDERAYIRRYYNARREAVVELSPSIERLFNYIENFEQKEFVGTESRFQTILFQLRDLSSHINEDPKARIAELEKQKNEIESEIEKIKLTGKAQVYTEVEIQERLDDIHRTARELMSDFQQIAENFRKIFQTIYKKQSETESKRAEILGYTLDADKALRASAQGQSFSSFWNFISQDKNEEISALVKNILRTTQEKNALNILTADKIDFFYSLKRNLFDAGRKIVAQNRNLSDRLSGVLRSQNSINQKQIQKLTADIKKIMGVYVERKKSGKISASDTANFMFVETKPEINFPQSRKPRLPEMLSNFSKIENAAQNFDYETLSEMFNQFYVDEKILLKNIADFRAQKNGSQFTLSELVSAFPIQKGLSEILSYYAIATRENFAAIQNDKTDKINFNDGEKTLSAPRIIFS